VAWIPQKVESTLKAKGMLISDRTAVRATAALFGVEDVEEELEAIEQEAAERQVQLGSGPDQLQLDLDNAPRPARAGTTDEDEPEDD
jgi:hypothetical protein